MSRWLKPLRYVRARIRKLLLEEIWLEDCIRQGMQVGEGCSIQPGVVFDYSHCWLIRIGNRVTIAPEAYLLAHDASSKPAVGYTRVGSVVVEDDAFIGARAVIMPGVRIGQGAVVAAGSVVTKSVPPGCIVAGNPARPISDVAQYYDKLTRMAQTAKTYDASYTIGHKAPRHKRAQMAEELLYENGFVR